jgi:hypothetical protein
MGLPLTETFMREHRESISCCFIEAGRAGVRLPSAVHLPPLAQSSESLVSENSADGHPVEPVPEAVATPPRPTRPRRPPTPPRARSSAS